MALSVKYICFTILTFFGIFTHDSPKVPGDYDAMHKQYTLQGGRVIALARRSLGKDVTVRDVTREDAERELCFCGFVVSVCRQ